MRVRPLDGALFCEVSGQPKGVPGRVFFSPAALEETRLPLARVIYGQIASWSVGSWAAWGGDGGGGIKQELFSCGREKLGWRRPMERLVTTTIIAVTCLLAFEFCLDKFFVLVGNHLCYVSMAYGVGGCCGSGLYHRPALVPAKA
jgi:hypothetical protein